MMTITPLKIEQLVKPSMDEYKPFQTNFFEAYLSHKKAGSCLLVGKLPREAFLSLNIAAECLLKGIYDCVKFHYFRSNDQLRTLVEKNVGKKFQEHLDAKNFGHKVYELSKIILQMFDELNQEFSNHYQKLTDTMRDTNIDFITERYRDPKLKPFNYWEQNSIKLLGALENLEQNVFSHLFEGQ